MAPTESYTATQPHLNLTSILAIIWLEAALAGIFVAARLWIRMTIDKALKWNDFFSFMAFACLIIMCALYVDALPRIYDLIDVVDGVQSPGPDFEAQQSIFLKEQFGIIVLFWTSIWDVKFSFLTFYRGIFERTRQRWKIHALYVVAGICIVAYAGCLATQFRSCWPLYTYFKLGQCETTRDLYVSNMSLFYSTAVDIGCDILIMALPLSILGELMKMDRKQKFQLGGVFSVGVIIIIFAVLRLIYTRPSIGHVDPKWLCIMSVTESSVAVMVSCAPPLRKLLKERERTKQQSASWSAQATPSRKNNRSTATDEERSMSQIPLQESWSQSSIPPTSARSEKSDSPRIVAREEEIITKTSEGAILKTAKAKITGLHNAWFHKFS